MLCASQLIFRYPKNYHTRTLTYFVLRFSVTLSVTSLIIRAQEMILYKSILLASYRNLIILNFIGGMFYGTRIPERFYRNNFDIFSSSHQIMYIMVVWGALLYRTGLLAAI